MGGQLLSAYEIYNSWKNSPGHYRAMVNPSVKTAGIGVCTQGGCGYAAILAFGYNQQINEGIKTGTCAKDRVISGLHVENCSFGGSSTVGGTYQFPYQTAVPLYLIYQGQDDRRAGKSAGCVFDPQSDTGDCRGGRWDDLCESIRKGGSAGMLKAGAVCSLACFIFDPD